MHVRLSVASLVLPTVALAASSGSQLFFSPPLSSFPSSSTSAPISLSAPQANAVLAHHLGVSSYVDLPLSSSRDGARDWEETLESNPAEDSKFVIVLECPKQGCQDVLPTSVQLSQPYTLPPLPANSYLAALSLHLHRLADSLHLSAEESDSVKGLKRVVEQGLKSVAGWQGWVGKELASWIGYDQPDYRIQPVVPVESTVTKSGLLSDLDFLDESGNQLVMELENLVSIGDSFSSEHLPKIIIVHLKGLRELAAKHSPSSAQYQRAATLVQQTLSATLASYQQNSRSRSLSSQSLLLTLPPPQTPLLRKRQPWLHPFSTSVSRYTSRTRSTGAQLHQNVKRSVFVSERASEEEDNDQKQKNSKVIVPTSSKCFKSLSDLNNQTASCLSRGQGVQGISTRGDAGECWVCKCGSTTDEETGKKTYWAGQGCEKKDLSSSFSLLFFSSLGLVLILVASVSLLYNIGSVELPGTLSAVGGTGGGHIKRD